MLALQLQGPGPCAAPKSIVLEVSDSAECCILPVAASRDQYVLVAWREGEDTFYQAFEWVPGTHYILMIPDHLYAEIYQELCDLIP